MSKRHRLQKWANVHQGVVLQIFDGQAIAELLSDRDTFWIAQEYLRIPGDLFPQSTADADWYNASLERWKNRKPLLFSQANLVEIKCALRWAAAHDDARQDLVFWMKMLEEYLNDDAPRVMRRDAIYELAIASLRAKGEMTSNLALIQDYYSDLEEWVRIADLQDAATLLLCAFGAWGTGRLAIEPERLFQWRSRLVDCLDTNIAEAGGPGWCCGLLNIRGYLCIMPRSEGGTPAIDEGFEIWSTMLDQIDKAPLFPLESFADFLTKTTSILGHHQRFRELTERADDLIARRSGNATAAEKSFDRALAYVKHDDLVNAIRQLDRAEIKWFSGETLEQTVKAILLLSQCYRQLRLAYAAKYYALAAASVACHSDDEDVSRHLPEALFAVADADDACGNSLGFIQILPYAIGAQCCFGPNPLDVLDHPSVETNLGQVAALRGLALRSGPDWLSPIDDVLALWPSELRDPIIRASEDPTGFWFQDSWKAAWATIEESFLGHPFGDMGKKRVIEFKALGVHWAVSFDNSYSCMPEAEQFISQFQIGLAAFAGIDLCLLPTRVTIDVSVHTRRRKIALEEVRSNEPGLSWSLKLPANTINHDAKKYLVDALAIFSTIIRRCSLLPEEQLLNVLEHTLADGLFERVFVARPFAEIYRELIPSNIFNDALRAKAMPFKPELPFAVQQHAALSWFDAPGPTYSERTAIESIQARYDRGMRAVGITVKRLVQDSDTRELLFDLHQNGMKDWEVLSIVLNAATNLRHQLESEPTAADVQRFKAAFEVEEQVCTALWPQEFTPEIMKATREAFLGAHADSWGLCMNGCVFDLSALETLLIKRYGLRRDDVDHEDIFGWSTLEVDGCV